MNTEERGGNAVPETSQAPYATDGTDFRGALRSYYLRALKLFVKWFTPFAAVFAIFDVTNSDYAFPLGVVGVIGTGCTVILLGSRVWWTWSCSRVLRTYPLQFRRPVEKVRREGGLTYSIRFLDKGPDSLVMKARDPLGRKGWAPGIEDGVWFAGDDPFGGVVLVRGSGELLFMQPKEWKLAAEERLNTGAERIKRARRAGIKWGHTIR